MTTTKGVALYGYPKTKCIHDLSWWATDLNLRGKQIYPSDFDSTMMKDCIDEENLDYEYGKKDPDTKKPDDFSYRKWVAWEEMVYYYFIATKKS